MDARGERRRDASPRPRSPRRSRATSTTCGGRARSGFGRVRRRTGDGRRRGRSDVVLARAWPQARAPDRDRDRTLGAPRPGRLAGAHRGRDLGNPGRSGRGREGRPGRRGRPHPDARSAGTVGAEPRGGLEASAFRQLVTAAPFAGKVSTPYGPGTVHDYMHAKVTVADDIVFVGSYNLSDPAGERGERPGDRRCRARRSARSVRRRDPTAGYPRGSTPDPAPNR